MVVMTGFFAHWRSRLFGPEGTLASSTGSESPRLLSVDALRGFIIVVMALDHANSLIAHGKLEPEMWADVFPNYRWINPEGIGIRRMYPYWLLGLAILFPLCWLYGRSKTGRSPDSVWRFL